MNETGSTGKLATGPSTRFRRRRLLETLGERFRSAPLAPSARGWLKAAYHSALMLGTGGRGLRSELTHGEVVRALPGHRQLAWNPAEYEAFRRAVRPGAVALDVGANVGAYALLLGQWAGSSGAVYAFEPAPGAFAGLEGHVALNRLADVIRPVRAAIGDREGSAHLTISGTAGESRLVGAGEPAAAVSTIDVPIVTIDRFCERQGLAPDFIKIDVEGWELAALRGARRTIAARRGALALFVELHPSIWPSLGITRAEIEDELELQGLTVQPLVPGADAWMMEGVAARLVPRPL